jgi:hypothetical protein
MSTQLQHAGGADDNCDLAGTAAVLLQGAFVLVPACCCAHPLCWYRWVVVRSDSCNDGLRSSHTRAHSM